MTPEEQRAALAEWAGWKPQTICTDILGNPWPDVPPDYLNDLNAVHELEKKLTDEQTSIYSSYLFQNKSARPGRGAIYWGVVHATATQRCEALLETLNIWKGGEA